MREREDACPIEPRRTLRLLALRTSADWPLMGGRNGSMKVRLWEWEGSFVEWRFLPGKCCANDQECFPRLSRYLRRLNERYTGK